MDKIADHRETMAPVASALPGITQHKLDVNAEIYEPKIDKSASAESIKEQAVHEHSTNRDQ